jgi:hypothetical protein
MPGLWTSHNTVGSVPSMNDSSTESGQAVVASWAVWGSIVRVTIPGGTGNETN